MQNLNGLMLWEFLCLFKQNIASNSVLTAIGLTCFDCHILVVPLMAPIRFELEYLNVLSLCCFILNIEYTKVGLSTELFP